MSKPGEKREFKTELKQLLHLITHSLYSNREIFLRELISNASDAINKIKFNSLDKDEILEGNKDWKIQIVPDKDKKTLTIIDNGIGMSHDDVIENLGTIAKSGTKAFLERLNQEKAQAKPELIGQFGVGFYSAFMVADKVTVRTRAAGPNAEAVKWESDGQGDYLIESTEKADRGTEITLHLKEEAEEFLDRYKLRTLVRKFSDFVEYPIVMEVEHFDEKGNKELKPETLNSQKAIWLRPKSEITLEEYQTFYQQISNDYEKPAKVIHYTAEGRTEFRVLMFIPAKKPFNFDWEEPKGLRLYIQRVLIMETCDGLLPGYLRFVRGVVDSADLPLNISRELLQHNPMLEKIQKNVVSNIFDELNSLRTNEAEVYRSFFNEFGDHLKRGIGDDRTNREKLADLLLVQSMNTPKENVITLADYVEKMPANQESIYYLIGESRSLIEHSPLLEKFRADGFDVLFLVDPIDEYAFPSLGEYKGKKLQAIDRVPASKENETHPQEENFKDLIQLLKEKITDVGDIKLSNRLKESASCLVADANAMTAHYERLMQRMGRLDGSEGKRTLEINPDHPIVQKLKTIHQQNPADPLLELFGNLLYEQAVIAEGSKIKDPAGFSKRINDLIARA